MGQNSTNNSNRFTVVGSGDFTNGLSLGITSTNNGNKLTVSGNSDFTGNVGIGVTNPGAKLDINTGTSQVKIVGAASGAGQNSSGSYPLLVSGSQQGIWISVNGNSSGTPNSSNNYLTFTDATLNGRGAIEGQTQSELTNSFDYIWNTTISAIQLVMGAGLAIADIAGLDDFDASVIEALNIPLEAGQFAYNQANMISNVGVSFSSGNADYAEWLMRKDENEIIRASEIVGVTGGLISKNTTNANHVMAVSSAPLVLGNAPKEGESDKYEKVAFLGQVFVKVFGKVSLGDFIVASGKNDGVGKGIHPDEMADEDYKNIVGVAWSTNELNGPGLINTLVGKSNSEYLSLLKKRDNEIANLKAQLNEMSSFLSSKFADYKTNPDNSISTQPEASNFDVPSSSVQISSLNNVLSKGKIDYTELKKKFVENKEVASKLLLIAKKRCENLGVDFSSHPELLKLFDTNELDKTFDVLQATQ
ncbi:MAG: hypothetical protein IPK10_13960 [Bacteroidetes bacterium]|nr:hypothetical protein [Bacteroidota bacterium]